MNAQKSNGSPVINDTGIEAFMFFICRTKYGRPSIVGGAQERVAERLE